MKVFLRSVTLKSSGLYRCEVSAEAPSFASVQREGYLEVICKCLKNFLLNFHLEYRFFHFSCIFLALDLSHAAPTIQGEDTLVGDNKLSLNCSSGKSYPASKLQFYINDEPVSIKFIYF